MLLLQVTFHSVLTFPRLGAPLEGAYVIWDDLLKSIVREQKQFALVLIKALLEAMSSPSPGLSDQDSEKEAMCLWTSHILHSKEWRHSFTRLEYVNLLKDAMMWCCVNPGQWTQRLGKEMLKVQDEEFVDDWQDVFAASQLGDARGADLDHQSPGYLNDVNVEPTPGDKSRKKSVVDSEDDSELGRWVRAAKPSAAPIGVVQ